MFKQIDHVSETTMSLAARMPNDFFFRFKKLPTQPMFRKDAPSKIQPTHCVLYLFTFTENGKLYAQIHIGLTEKTIVIGEALGDDLWHSVKLERRGMVLSLGLDDDRPIIGKLFLRSIEFMLGLV